MTDEQGVTNPTPVPTPKSKGGRPRLLPAPQNAADARALLSAEIVKNKPRHLGMLRRLLESFERAEQQALQAETNRVQAEKNDIAHKEYLRRREVADLRAATPDGKKWTALREQVTTLRANVTRLEKENETLKQENARLSEDSWERLKLNYEKHCLEGRVTELEGKLATTPATPSSAEIDPQVEEWKKSDETLKRLQAEARRMTLTALMERKAVLDSEWDELNATPKRAVSQEIYERMNAIALELRVITDFQTNPKAGDHA
jgi:predicted RNase H-like nuclease (RuvC/YqgF family)